MRPVVPILALLSLAAAPAAVAQHGGAPGSARVPPSAAKQFDFLVGQWELTIKPKASSMAARLHGSPVLVGTWKAWQAFDGWGIEDELRIVDRSGNPMALTHTIRVFDQASSRWNQTALDVYRGRFVEGNGGRESGEMTVTSSSTDADGNRILTRYTFTKVTPSSFIARQDRSVDGGQKWEEGTLVIEAKRVAASAPR